MRLISIIILAFVMATDAFAAAIGKGATLGKPDFREAVKTGVIFGTIEASTPVIGWGLGRVAQMYVTEWDHWIAFGLLLILGLRMFFASLRNDDSADDESHSVWALAIAGFATSIDAMAAGFGLAVVNMDIVVPAVAFGLATMLLVTIGVLVGRSVDPALRRWVEATGGVLLLGIGCIILLSAAS